MIEKAIQHEDPACVQCRAFSSQTRPDCGRFLPVLVVLVLGFLAKSYGGQVVSWGHEYHQMPDPPRNLDGIVGIAAGADHSLALREDGTVLAWGKNGNTNVPTGLTDAIAVSAGWEHSLALRKNGSVFAWGTNSRLTDVPPDLHGVVAIAAGGRHSIALREDGTVVEWPLNRVGPEANIPNKLSGVIAISAGYDFNVALRGNGELVAWGFNNHAELAIPFAATNVVGVSAGPDYGLALRADGAVIDWGGNRYPRGEPGPLISREVRAVAAGGISGGISWVHLHGDGRVLEWPWSYAGGQWLRLDARLQATKAVAISAKYHGLALIGAGAPRFLERSARRYAVAGLSAVLMTASPAAGLPPFVYEWQHNGRDIAGAYESTLRLDKPVPADAGVYSLRASNLHGSGISEGILLEVAPLAISAHPRSQGVTPGATAVFDVTAVGVDLRAQWLWNGQELPGETNITLVVPQVSEANEGMYSVRLSNTYGALTSQEARLLLGTVATWGANGYGQTDVPPGLGDVIGVSAGDLSSFAIDDRGTLHAWGTNLFGPLFPKPLLDRIETLDAGFRHSLGLTKEGKVFAWGEESSEKTIVPTDLSNVVAIASGGAFSVALRADGTIRSWGGVPSLIIPPRPVISNAVSISAGAGYWLALKADGTVSAEGDVGPDWANTLSGLTEIVAIDAGSLHNLALKADGTVVAFGDNQFGQATVPNGLSGVIAVSAGSLFSTALKSDGMVVSWGAGYDGQTNVPIGLKGVTQISAGAGHTLAIVSEGPPVLQRAVIKRRVLAGTFAHLSIPATGRWPLMYQWRHEGRDLPNETNSFFVLRDPHPTQAGKYSVYITNTAGSVLSPEFELEIEPAWVTLSPSDVVTFQDGAASFEITAEGVDLEYRWLFNDRIIPGETNRLLNLSRAQPAQAGTYTAVVTNSYGTVTVGASLTVAPAIINTQPTTQTQLFNNPTDLRVEAQGTDVQYQWRFNGRDILGETNGIFHIAAVNWENSGTYTVNVRSVYGEVVSSNAVVTAVPILSLGGAPLPPAITNIVSISVGARHTLASLMDGSVVDSSSFGGATAPKGVSNIVAISAGVRHSLALRDDGTVVAWEIGAIPGFYPPDFGQARVPAFLDNVVAISAGMFESLALRADGSVVSWGRLPGMPFGLNNVMEVSAGNSGSIALRADGSIIAWGSESYRQLSRLTNITAIAAADDFGFALRADGSVFWLRSFGPYLVPGVSNIVKVAPGFLLGADGALTNYFGGSPKLTGVIDISGSAFNFHGLAVGGPPEPRILPEVRTRYGVAGSSAFFGPRVVGAHPFEYQWMFNGTDIPGATNRVLWFPNLRSDQGGLYQIRVHNSHGENRSVEMRLIVMPPNQLDLKVEARQAFPGVLLKLSSPVGSNIRLETSTNLVEWLLSRSATNVSTPIFISESAELSSKFYRLRNQE